MSLLEQIHNRLFMMTKRHDDGLARPYSRYMESLYGRQWYVVKRELEENGSLTLVENSYYRTDLRSNGERLKGRTAGYSVSRPEYPVISAEFNTLAPITTFERRYLETHARTNLSAPFVALGNGDDTRNYTDYTVLPKTIRETVTIDGEATVEVDISNTFFLAVANSLPARIKDVDVFKELVYSGLLYDEVARLANVSRAEAKLALNIALNNKRHLKFSTIASSYAWTAFQSMFAGIARWIRKEARQGNSWKRCNGWEGEIRKAVLKQSYKDLGYQPLDSHDGFRVKIADVGVFVRLLRSIHKGLPVKYSSTTSSPLVCNTPTSSLPYPSKLAEFFTIDPPPKVQPS